VTVKAAMTLDGKIATATGQSRWITSEPARAHAQRLRFGHDAILVGIRTLLADDPQLTVRPTGRGAAPSALPAKSFRRIVLDTCARTPLDARVLARDSGHTTTIVVGTHAPIRKIRALTSLAHVMVAPVRRNRIDLEWLLEQLGAEQVTSLLVDGGGEVQAAFLLGGLAQRVAFYYAPKILGGRHDVKAVSGAGARTWNEILELTDLHWRRLGPDLFLSARVAANPAQVTS
jgi:diaminohydroxyphosphoribosylaminopyrimidine deaminase/5-amino-6-(5-phosphoribosylamino)uracil reductase